MQHTRHRISLHREWDHDRRRTRLILIVVDEGNELSYQRIGIGVDGGVLIGRQQISLHQDGIAVDVPST